MTAIGNNANEKNSHALEKRMKMLSEYVAPLVSDLPGRAFLIGPLTFGLAHSRSDIDVLVINEHYVGQNSLEATVIDDIRIDFEVWSSDELLEIRELLQRFSVYFDDIDVFRKARRLMPRLTSYVVAKEISVASGGLASKDEIVTYRKWAGAHVMETVLSHDEDLIGFLESEMEEETRFVWQQLITEVRRLYLLACGVPIFADKWSSRLELCFGSNPAIELLNAPVNESCAKAIHSAFDDLRGVVVESLCQLSGDLPGDWIFPEMAAEFGWLPQVYADGWFVKRCDTRIPLVRRK